MTTEQSPPVARRIPQERTHHGDTVVDEYEWLRAKDDPETIAYLEAENSYTERQTEHLAGLRESIFTEIKDRTQETDLSVPTRRGSWWYYTRTVEGRQYGLHCRRRVDDPDDWTPPELDAHEDVDGEQVLLDGNAEAEGHDFFALGAFSVSRDGNLLAYATDTTGDERFTIRVKDLRTGELLADTIPNAHYGATWSLQGTHLFYTTVDDAWRPDKVWRHRIGAPTDDDVVVLHEPDDRYWVGVGSTRSERYLVIALGSKVTSEYHVIDAAEPEQEPRVVLPRREGVEYSVDHVVVDGSDRFLILHNDGAENFELVETPADATDPSNWRTLLPHDPAVRLESSDAFADRIVVGYRRDALTRLGVIEIGAGGYAPIHEIEFDETLFACDTAGNPEWTQPFVRIVYTSFVTPMTVYDYAPDSGSLVVRKRQPVLGGYDPADYEQHRAWAIADDGERIPISVVVRKGTPHDGSAPFLLYGYGAYEASSDPGFSIARLSLLDRGMGYAVAHVRGGGEMGRHWYENGRLLTKRNTFTDFVAAARQLVADGWTSHDRLVAEGASAGGLLMGAVANIAPEAFAGVLTEVPFVDALTSILDPSLPLTVIEWDEWGNPLRDSDVYAYMKAYSPYENVTAQAYPPILATTSLHDTRVLYVEPAKWVARLRAVTDGAADVLLKTEMSAGHGGVSGRYESWRERAYELAWALDKAGLASS
ncbi:S9 family peptidase [Solicola gregarius]|uniref:S9 family peptidase n=1 Tax=Solicola gregarius TaxID=2908642 RepID=A0AA46YK40_9ACTN|nr:S9 family peptidase [Solicola gregarius]UYM05295.1 S9 family peptidase [Solicola gregarius]